MNRPLHSTRARTYRILCFFAAFIISCGLGLAQTTIPFAYTGAAQTFTVPPCVFTLHIKAWGGGGSGGGTDSYNGAAGGGGAYIESDIAVVPGQVLTIIVGSGGGAGVGCVTGAGGGPAGFGNGVVDGAAGGNSGGQGCSGGGGGGGGAAGVFSGATPLIVAGGGGGGSGGGQFSSGALGGGGGQNGNSVAGSCTSPGITGASGNGNGTAGGTKGFFADGGGGGGGGGGFLGGTGGAIASGCDCGACGGAGGSSGSSGTNIIVTNGNGQTPGNSADPDLPAGDALGGGGSTSGGNGYLVLFYPATAAPPTATVTSFTNPSCFNSSDGSATAIGSGGAGTYTYSWTPSAQTTAAATALAAGLYTVTVTDKNGCSSTSTQTLTAPSQLAVNAAGINVSCFGGCNGQLICIPSGATLPYTYSWNPGCAAASCNNVCAGTYTVTVTDGKGCVATGTTVVTQPPAITLSMFPVSAHCNKPDGYDSVSVAGGTGAYTYSWSAGAGSALPGYHNLSPGSYTVVVQDANHCLGADTNKVANIPGLTASIPVNTAVTCFNGTNGTATAASAGSVGKITYAWTPTGGAAITASNLSAGIYTCTITDSVGCKDQASVTITQPALLKVIPMPPATICISQSDSLIATATGGTPAYTYAWNNAAGIITNAPSPATTTTYTVNCTDVNGCLAAPQTVTITVRPPLTALATGAASICPGAGTPLGCTAGGGDAVYAYSWTPSTGLSSPTAQNPIATPAATTTYTVYVTDNCGTPRDSSTVTVVLYPNPVPVFSTPDTAGCAPFCVTFHDVSVPACASAVWTFGEGGTGSGCDSTKHCYLTAGSFSCQVKVTDIHGCKTTVTKPNYITVFPLPVASFTAGPQPITILTPKISFQDISTGAVTRGWNFGVSPAVLDSIKNPSYTYPDTGCYKVVLNVKSVDGCVDTARQLICIDPLFTFYAPDAFTPNGDQKNDIWKPMGEDIDPKHYELSIYDRWGNLVFHTTTWDTGWDGKSNNGSEISQIDTYVWVAVLKDIKGNHYTYRGILHLIK
jgi:gliding motility-associated-like protein